MDPDMDHDSDEFLLVEKDLAVSNRHLRTAPPPQSPPAHPLPPPPPPQQTFTVPKSLPLGAGSQELTRRLSDCRRSVPAFRPPAAGPPHLALLSHSLPTNPSAVQASVESIRRELELRLTEIGLAVSVDHPTGSPASGDRLSSSPVELHPREGPYPFPVRSFPDSTATLTTTDDSDEDGGGGIRATSVLSTETIPLPESQLPRLCAMPTSSTAPSADPLAPSLRLLFVGDVPETAGQTALIVAKFRQMWGLATTATRYHIGGPSLTTNSPGTVAPPALDLREAVYALNSNNNGNGDNNNNNNNDDAGETGPFFLSPVWGGRGTGGASHEAPLALDSGPYVGVLNLVGSLDPPENAPSHYQSTFRTPKAQSLLELCHRQTMLYHRMGYTRLPEGPDAGTFSGSEGYPKVTLRRAVSSPAATRGGGPLRPILNLVVYFLSEDRIDRDILEIQTLAAYLPVLPLLQPAALRANGSPLRSATTSRDSLCHEFATAFLFNSLGQALVHLEQEHHQSGEVRGDESGSVLALSRSQSQYHSLSPLPGSTTDLLELDPPQLYRTLLTNVDRLVRQGLPGVYTGSVPATPSIAKTLSAHGLVSPFDEDSGSDSASSSSPSRLLTWVSTAIRLSVFLFAALWLIATVVPGDDVGLASHLNELGLSPLESRLDHLGCQLGPDDTLVCHYNLLLRNDRGQSRLFGTKPSMVPVGQRCAALLNGTVQSHLGLTGQSAKIDTESKVHTSPAVPMRLSRRWTELVDQPWNPLPQSPAVVTASQSQAAFGCQLTLEAVVPASAGVITPDCFPVMSVWFSGNPIPVQGSPWAFTPSLIHTYRVAAHRDSGAGGGASIPLPRATDAGVETDSAGADRESSATQAEKVEMEEEVHSREADDAEEAHVRAAQFFGRIYSHLVAHEADRLFNPTETLSTSPAPLAKETLIDEPSEERPHTASLSVGPLGLGLRPAAETPWESARQTVTEWTQQVHMLAYYWYNYTRSVLGHYSAPGTPIGQLVDYADQARAQIRQTLGPVLLPMAEEFDRTYRGVRDYMVQVADRRYRTFHTKSRRLIAHAKMVRYRVAIHSLLTKQWIRSQWERMAKFLDTRATV
ncbi:hypothetical protein BJ085DRAFT_34258 [Dimargaris cristalligena]|uniref:Uncharacterized protein n=1 Tax=Dimargaris cristalligena TaxID=215637 RepID=A0A4Q0A0X3_9FUNG|nr:hypothetical protein BJ085DRAFT_34258 [Dimargaris cristalligena]|eukprot:RKP39713.1 hypothetical protein BJ085DRAFT_34258 [Dimargaris cristalligena]